MVHADVVQYFDTIPHRELLQSVARRIADRKILRLLKLWLKSPVDEQDGSGRWTRTGGKKSRRGTPQGGVISPLLANVYINRLLRHWRKTGTAEKLGRIVSYADDFVILCKTRHQAEQSLARVTRWLAGLGLAIHPEKTRLCFAGRDSFDFLGYTFGPMRHWRTGATFIGAQPSRKSAKSLKEKVNTLLYRGNPEPWPALRDRLNRLLTGWASYFSFGYTGTADGAIWWHVARRVRRFLCKRHKLRPQGASQFSATEVYGPVGVVDLRLYRRERRLAHACS